MIKSNISKSANVSLSLVFSHICQLFNVFIQNAYIIIIVVIITIVFWCHLIKYFSLFLNLLFSMFHLIKSNGPSMSSTYTHTILKQANISTVTLEYLNIYGSFVLILIYLIVFDFTKLFVPSA